MQKRMNDTARRKQQILLAAQKTFLKKGYYKTTIDDIASEVGVVRGTVLHYFRSKDELMEAVLDQSGAQFVQSLQEVLCESSISVSNRIAQMKQLCNTQFQMLKPQLDKFGDEKNKFRFLTDQMRLQTYYELGAPMKQLLDDGTKEGVFQIENTYARAQSILFAIFGITGADLNSKEIEKEFDWIFEQLLARGDILK